jgi:simple sugar transport system permease protein
VATRSWAVLTTGALAGLGGAYLSVIGAGIFVPFMTNGQGYIGIVIAMLARGKPLFVMLSAFLFGMALSLSTALQIVGINISTDVVNMLPFAVVLVAIVVFARRSYLPTALALPYVRGSRG